MGGQGCTYKGMVKEDFKCEGDMEVITAATKFVFLTLKPSKNQAQPGLDRKKKTQNKTVERETPLHG